MMVNAAPRLATILCLDLSQSRLNCGISATANLIPLIWKLYPMAMSASASGTEIHETRLTLAIPIGEAASDIAGAILMLKL